MRILSFVLALLFFATTACDGGCGNKDEKIPEKPVERVEQMGERLPQGIELALFVGDIEANRKSLTTLSERLGQKGLVDNVTTNFKTKIGIDPLSRESWKTAGVAPDSGFTISYYRDRVIFLTYVENRQKFEKILTEKTKKAFGIEAVVKSEKHGKFDMKVLSQDPARQIAWLYQGKMALVVMPALTGQGALQEGSATTILADVAGLEKKSSIVSLPQWASFKKRLASQYPVTAYLNSGSYLDSDEFKKDLEENPALSTTADWAKKNVQFLGAGLKATSDDAELVVYGDTSKEFVAAAKKVKKVARAEDWTGFATENTMLGIRLSVDPEAAWALFLENMPEQERRGFLRRIGILGTSYNVDIEKDIINKLSGNLGVFFYGIAGNPLRLLNADASTLASKAGLLVVLPFEDEASLNALLEKAIGPLGQLVAMRNAALPDGKEDPQMRVLELQMPTAPGRFYVSGNHLVFATTAFGDSAIKKYLSGNRPEKSISEVERLDLGKAFSTGENFNGVYFNAERAISNLGAAVAIGGFGDILAQVEEASLSFDVEESGVAATLRVDLSSDESGQAADQDGKEAPKADEKSGQKTDEGQK